MNRELYFDNAATTRLDAGALKAMFDFEVGGRANVGRGVYPAAVEATRRYEEARGAIANFFGVKSDNFIFSHSVTGAINGLARSMAQPQFRGRRNRIITTAFDHNSITLVWEALCYENDLDWKVIPITQEGEIDLLEAERLINGSTFAVFLPQVSNVTGYHLPVSKLASLARAVGAKTVVDCAQGVGHGRVRLGDLGADVMVLGAHKMYGPLGIAGIGAVDGFLNQIKPTVWGGGALGAVGAKAYEVGTPNVTAVIGWKEAIENLRFEGAGGIIESERAVFETLLNGIKEEEAVKIFSDPTGEGTIISLVSLSAHPHDWADACGERGLAVRAGFHCTRFAAAWCSRVGTVRLSIGRENTQEEAEEAVKILRETLKEVSL